MEKLDTSELDVPSLSPRHFKEAGVPDHQLRVWSELTGFTSAGRAGQGWRRYSVADVWRLSVVQRFKERSQIALAMNTKLVDFLAASDNFARSVDIIRGGKSPQLVTDLRSTCEIFDGWPSTRRDLQRQSDFWIVFDLTRPVLISAIAALRGGNEKQKAIATSVLLQAPPITSSRKSHRKVDTRSKNNFGPEAALALAEKSLAGLS